MVIHIDVYKCCDCHNVYDSYGEAQMCERSHDDKEAA